MRTYIFTEKERKAISGFFNGSTPRDDPALMTVIYRIKSFRNLASDIELYLRLRKTEAASST
jgi:hypothetical protein